MTRSRSLAPSLAPSLVLAAALALASALGAACSEVAETAPRAGAERAWPQLREGVRGPDVRVAQLLLDHRGHAVSGDSEATFGLATAAAARAFQQQHGLAVDGIIGPRTWEALVDYVSAGDESSAVRALQLVLARYAEADLERELSEQRAGAATIEALRAEQARRCLVQSGDAGLYTWSALLGDFDYCQGGPSPKASFDEVAARARDAGVPCGEPLQLAVAIAAAESSLRSTAIRRNPPTSGCAEGSYDVGAWQINDCYHPEVGHGCALDLACASQSMYDVSRSGADWTPWTTYKNGAYAMFLDEARAAEARACAAPEARREAVAKGSR